MNSVIYKNKTVNLIATILFYMLFSAFLFDPGDNIFHAKVPIFLLIFLMYLLSNPILTKEKLKPIIIFLIIPLYGFFISIINKNDFNFALNILISFSLILLMLFYKTFDINIIKIFTRCSLLLSYCILILFLISLVAPDNIISALYDFGNDNVAFTIMTRAYGGITFPHIYFHSSPMLIFTVVYYWYKTYKCFRFRFLFFAIVMSLSLFLTGTRANMLMAIAGPLVVLLFSQNIKLGIRLFVMALAALVALIVFGDVLLAFFDISDSSNNLKLSYISCYYQSYIENPLYLICGAGIGGTIYVPLMNEYLLVTELTYLNFLYWFGIPLGLMFIIILIYPLFLNANESWWIKIALFLFLIMNTINPFIFSSNGMTILTISYYYIFRKHNNTISLLHNFSV